MSNKTLSRSSWFYKFLCLSEKNDSALRYEASDVTTCSIKWMAVRSVLTLCGMLGMLGLVCLFVGILSMCFGSLLALIAAWAMGHVPTLELLLVAIEKEAFLLPGIFFGLIGSAIGVVELSKAFTKWRRKVRYQRERALIMKGLPEPTPGIIETTWDDFVNKICRKVDIVD